MLWLSCVSFFMKEHLCSLQSIYNWGHWGQMAWGWNDHKTVPSKLRDLVVYTCCVLKSPVNVDVSKSKRKYTDILFWIMFSSICIGWWRKRESKYKNFWVACEKESVIYNVHVFAVPANKKGILMIYALNSGHPAGVDPGECAGIWATMFTNLPHPRIVFLYQRATTSPLTLHSSWFKWSFTLRNEVYQGTSKLK